MEIITEVRASECIRITVQEREKEIARAYLYILKNDLHNEPIGYMEDVFVDVAYRSLGVGTKLLKNLIFEAKNRGCYKLVGTSRIEREKVHALYIRLGFVEHGKEFRMDL